jgi:hypothetical protein
VNKYFLVPLFLISVLIFYSCADDPSSVGLNLLEQDFLKIDTVNSVNDNFLQNSSYFKKVVSLGNSSVLLVGRTEDISAHTLINFAFLLPDSIKTDFTDGNVIIESALIEMFPKYHFPAEDSSADFDLEVHELLSGWGSSSFSADSFATLQFDQSDIGSNKTYGDSVYSFNIGVDVVRKWIDFSINPDSLTNYGILVSPTSSIQKIVGFEAFSPFTDLQTKLTIVISKQGSYTDTINGFVASDISVVLGDLPDAGPDYMLVQSSLTINSKLYFDLSSIPENVVINSARLVIYPDTTKGKYGSSFENSLVSFLISDSSDNTVNDELFIRIPFEEGKYTGDLTPMIRKWLRDGDNYGMLIRTGSEQVGTELFYLYGSQAGDVLKRPYLEIVYSYNL